MTKNDNQPDWDTLAEKFDYFLPYLAPVGDVLIKELKAQPSDHILDVASGTGEPALTLAANTINGMTIIGTDAAQGMVNVAQKKAQSQGFKNIEFQCMPAEQLTFTDNTFDKVLSRFGVMLFEDSLQGLKEMRRVLKPGGRYALAVWSTPETMPTLLWSYEAFKHRIPEDAHPPLAKVTSLGHPGALKNIMAEAGFHDAQITPHTFHYEFPSFDTYWDVFTASDILKLQFDALPSGQMNAVRDEIASFANQFQTDNGLKIPHEFLLASGVK